MNYDKLFIERCEKDWKERRMNTFEKMFNKHFSTYFKKGYVEKGRKKEKLEFKDDKLVQGLNIIKKIIQDREIPNKKKMNELYESNLLDMFYVIIQSITQSFKPQIGKRFEDTFYDILDECGISYSKQIIIDDKGRICSNKIKGKKYHVVDALIPECKECINITKFDGLIISLKTTTRERYLQDKFLGKFYIITYDDILTTDDMYVVKLDTKQKNFTKFVKYCIKHYKT